MPQIKKTFIKDWALELIPDEFKTGYRVLVVCHRSKDGGKNSGDHSRKRVITTGIEDWNEKYKKLATEIIDRNIGERIYCNINARDFNKGIREFKRQQLEADYYDDSSKSGFYLDMKNRFISCLCKPSSADGSLFLLDCDSGEAYNQAIHFCNCNNLKIHWMYPTKNGNHIITDPFNPELAGSCEFEVKKDSMYLALFS